MALCSNFNSSSPENKSVFTAKSPGYSLSATADVLGASKKMSFLYGYGPMFSSRYLSAFLIAWEYRLINFSFSGWINRSIRNSVPFARLKITLSEIISSVAAQIKSWIPDCTKWYAVLTDTSWGLCSIAGEIILYSLGTMISTVYSEKSE